MKKQVRMGVFETNSSSIHSLCIVSEEEMNDWKDGKTAFCNWTKEFKEVENLQEVPGREGRYEDSEGDEFQSYDVYFDDYELESYEESYTTKHGDTVYAFGKYGHD